MESRLTLALTAGLPVLVVVAAMAALLRPTRATVPVLLLAAALLAVSGVAILPGVRRAVEVHETAVAAWSPLGLYGVELSVRTNALGSFLSVPCMVAALAGWVRAYGPPWRDPLSTRIPVGRPGVDGALLGALAGGAWTLVAGDLVSMVLGTGTFFVATALALRLAGASAAARARIVVTGGFSLCLLVCMLLLGKVNGSFAAAQLASVSFSDASLAGLVIIAYGVGNAVPFHGWALLLARQPLMPAVAAVGSALSLAMVDVAFVTTGGELADAWRSVLTSLGVVAIAGAVLVAWGPRQPRLRLATLAGGRTGLGLLAIASGAPATMSALALLHGVAATGAALLWVAAPGGSGARREGTASGVRRGLLGLPTRVPAPGLAPRRGLPNPDLSWPARLEQMAAPVTKPGAGRGRPSSTPLGGDEGTYGRPATKRDRGEYVSAGIVDLRLDAWRSAGPWLVVLVVATAAGLPGTIGGLAADTYLSALAASNDAGWWLRIAALVLDTATIGAGGAVLASGITAALTARMARARPIDHAIDAWAPPDDAWRNRGTVGDVLRDLLPWLGVAVGIAAVVAPALLPVTFVGPWFAPVSVVMAGTTSPPRLVDAFRIASPDRIVLTIAAAIALYRTQRGEEMLPAPARALLGITVLLALPVVRIARGGYQFLFERVRDGASLLYEWSERATAIARLVEERYYTAVAVVVVIVLLYSVGR